MLHLIPDDGQPHAPTTECGCDPQLRQHGDRLALVHNSPDDFHEDDEPVADVLAAFEDGADGRTGQ